MEIKSILSGEDFAALVRETGLNSNPQLRPYHSADISLRSVEIDTLYPLAKYVLEENFTHLELIRSALLAQEIDIFHLPGRIESLLDTERIIVAPPVIEDWPREGHLIVDGLHRLWLARRHGIKRVTCVFIRNVSMPLVPLPISWDEVREYPTGQYPTEEDKRNYRFNKHSDALSILQAEELGITEENYKYFFFRDLSPLGSGGIRQFSPETARKEKI